MTFLVLCPLQAHLDPNSTAYSYFYDWSIQELPCTSNDVNFDIFVNPQLTSSFSFVQGGAVVNFNNTSPQGTSFLWDFGDGNTSTAQNAAHTYAASGTYQVTLTISDGVCEAVSRETVTIPSGVAIDPLLEQSFQLFPNPGTGRFTIQANTQQISNMQVLIYDLTGRQLYASPVQKTATFEEIFDLQQQPAGTYLIRFIVDGDQLIRKYILMK